MATASLASVLQQLRTLAHAKAYEEANDRQLLECFLAGREETAFITLLKRHGPMVFQVCRRIQANEQDAEDVFQATFLLLARKAGSIRQPESLASCLHSVAHRLALEARAQGTRRQARERKAADMRSTSTASDASGQELQGMLDEALRQVPEKYRVPLVLCYLEGKTQEEAARQLGCPLGTVRSRLARGRERLKKVLERQGVHLSAAALAAGLTGIAASAAVPPLLVHATARAALAYAAGKAAATLVSAQAAALVKEGLKAMFTMKLQFAAVLILATGALGLGAGALLSSLSGSLTQAAAQPKTSMAAEPRAQAASIAPQRPETKADKEGQQMIAIRGQVLDNNGKPLAGAKLFVRRPSKTEPAPETEIDSVGTADAEGRFNLTIDPPSDDPQLLYLAAYAAGFGIDWVNLSEHEPSKEATLRLPKDVPMSGRVVNTEGKPIAGVSVSVAAVTAPNDDKLEKYLIGWSSTIPYAVTIPPKRIFGPLDGITGAVITDQEGRFTLHGCGAERMVMLTISGAGVARSTPHVFTRPGFDPKPYNDLLPKKEQENLRALNRILGLYAPSFTFVAEAGRTVEGVTKDATTGKPVPGCRLYAQAGWSDEVRVLSDADGKYRLDGLPKNPRGYFVSVSPPKNTLYMNRVANGADTAGLRAIKLDIELAKGAVVAGRVVDRQTGKGVKAWIRFAPLPDNRFFGSKPGFDNYRSNRTMEDTDKEGRFRLLTIPGKALVMAQIHEGEKFHGKHLVPYRRAVPDPDHKDLFNYDKNYDTWTIRTAAGGESLSVENAVKVIDIKEDEETKVELFVDRGVTARLTVHDADGKPLAGAWVAGLTDSWPITYALPEPTAAVYALDPEKPRTLVVFHTEMKLGGTVTVRGDEKEPVIVKLGPVGEVTGRLMEADGNPLAGATVSFNSPSPIARELYRFANPTGQRVLTDKDGRFTLTNVVPGVSGTIPLPRPRGLTPF
jgi:RNA polymerase sigma factor (sigma-70 family)